MFFLLCLLDSRRILIRMRIQEAQKHMDPTDPDPQHLLLAAAGVAAGRGAGHERGHAGRLPAPVLPQDHCGGPAPTGTREDKLKSYLILLKYLVANATFSPFFFPALRIHDILVWIRIRIWIRGSMPLIIGSKSGSCYFCHWTSRCQQKTNFLNKFSPYYFLKIHLHHFSKIKSQKEVTKQ